MLVQSYKHYLRFLEKKPRVSILHRTFFILFITFLIAIGNLSAFFYFQYKKEAPIRAENHYLEVAVGGLIATGQSLDEIVTAAKIAGAKVKIVDNLKEASASTSGFAVSLDDTNRNIAHIETVQKNVTFQKSQLTKTQPPLKFTSINQELLIFFDDTLKVLDKLNKQQKFAKELLLSLGPNFYLPILTNDTLWQSEKNAEISTYYKGLKSEANEALIRLSHLNPPDEFALHLSIQTAYFELLVKTADEIINTLSQKDDPNSQNATQIEKAYQILIEESKKNNVLSQQLLSQRLKLVSTKENLGKFAAIKMKQNSLAQKLNDIYVNQPQVKIYRLPTFLKIFFSEGKLRNLKFEI